MTKRATLSLDPQRRSKGQPSHGFAADEPPKSASGPSTTPSPSPRPKKAGTWQAHRPKIAQADPVATPAAGQTEADSPDGRLSHPLSQQLATLVRHPVVRLISLGVAAGLSYYLLKRRL